MADPRDPLRTIDPSLGERPLGLRSSSAGSGIRASPRRSAPGNPAGPEHAGKAGSPRISSISSGPAVPPPQSSTARCSRRIATSRCSVARPLSGLRTARNRYRRRYGRPGSRRPRAPRPGTPPAAHRRGPRGGRGHSRARDGLPHSGHPRRAYLPKSDRASSSRFSRS